jgi:hypothetical protein
MVNDVIILQNSDLWKELMEYNLITGEKKIVLRSDSNFSIQGHFIRRKTGILKHKDNYLMFYKKSNKLYFQIDGKQYCLQDNDCTLSIENKGKYNVFYIKISGKTVFSQEYLSPRYYPINLADFEFNEDREEEQDFYLFINNVMKDKERQERIYSL